MNATLAGLLFALALCFGMLALVLLGRRLGQRHRLRFGGTVGAGLGPIEGAVFGLMSLLLAFAFSGAASRFDSRRGLIVVEANAIGSAYARLDLLAPTPRVHLQQRLRDYVDARLTLYRVAPDAARMRAAQARIDTLQRAIWQESVAAVREAPTPAIAAQLLLAVNEMTDAAASRSAAAAIHPALVIYLLLAAVMLICALFAGYAMGAGDAKSWLHVFGLVAVFAVTFYVIVDLEYPRLGLFRIAEFDQVLVDLRASMR